LLVVAKSSYNYFPFEVVKMLL